MTKLIYFATRIIFKEDAWAKTWVVYSNDIYFTKTIDPPTSVGSIIEHWPG